MAGLKVVYDALIFYLSCEEVGTVVHGDWTTVTAEVRCESGCGLYPWPHLFG